ncbi:MAG TPA: HXXEE domain-containing protein [Bacillus sp. (in: firmicutes)]|uniref:HXXEE domain-containing protein n=1 Tax=Bacillus litorisediminis TaxID=2922713 RepID=UPI001FAB9BC2|nr:HXXEE domain-containing protein [Bacillus litorisediminis]HWO75349.1 HXXEE domain-containing protein [Bacillus sp. (in: firmicutes)]
MQNDELILLIWLFPIIFAIHDFEEIVIVEKWIQRNKEDILAKLPKRAALFFENNFAMKTHQFSIIVFFEFVLISIATIMVHIFGFDGVSKWFYLSLFSVMFFHAFTHIGQAVFLQRYVIGLMTSIFLLIPYGAYFYFVFIDEGLLQPVEIGLSLIVGIGLFALFFPQLHKKVSKL